MPIYQFDKPPFGEGGFTRIHGLQCQSQSLARVCLSWLGEPAKIDELREKLTVLRAKWAIPGACERAANHLVDRIQNQVSLFPIPLN